MTETNRQPTCAERVESACESRLDDIRLMLNPSHDDVTLDDDGSLDTVLSIGDEEFRFDDTSAYRDEDGTLDLESFIESEFESMRDEMYSRFGEYGLSFAYQEESDQTAPYFCYLLSWGGPSEEIRFYVGYNGTQPYKVEFWYLDWFDGAHIDVTDNETIALLWDALTCGGDPDTLRHIAEQ